MPSDCGLAFVLIQHLERAHASSLAEILGRSTPLPTIEATDGMLVEANHIYVIPPAADLSLSQGRLKLEKRSEKSSSHYPVDQFFRSLAADLGPLAIGIVLSGSGTDGTQGLMAIKEACGVTFAQEEASAAFGSMPHSAIATGAVDFVLKPGEMAAELAKIERRAQTAISDSDASPLDWLPDEDTNLDKIFALLQKSGRTDFRHYKRKPVNRRIARRMLVEKIKSLGEYKTFLEENPGEISKLFREILINVTSFFREPASFDQLGKCLREKLKTASRFRE